MSDGFGPIGVSNSQETQIKPSAMARAVGTIAALLAGNFMLDRIHFASWDRVRCL